MVLATRAVDELCSGLLIAVMPTLQVALGLTLAQVGLLFQVLTVVAAVVEPVAGLLIDGWRRRPLLVVGAAGWGVALVMAALAADVVWLAAAFALVGLASGPLVQTGDVLLVEHHPGAEERASTRSGQLDTIGALLGPAAVAAVFWVGADAGPPLALSGVAVLVYGVLLARTPVLEVPRDHDGPAGGGRAVRRLLGEQRQRLGEVLGDGEARRWLAVFVCEAVRDAAVLFHPLWMAEVVGLDQSLVAVLLVWELVVGFAALFLLDRVLDRWDGRRVLGWSAILAVPATVAWLLAPSPGWAFVLAVPQAVAIAPLWPVTLARLLTAVPGRAGTVQAVAALAGLLPLAAVIGVLAEPFGLVPVLIVAHVLALGATAILAGARWARRLPRPGSPTTPA